MSNPAEQTTEQTPDDVQRLTPVAPKRIGRYEIQKVLGFGAFGRVYEAFDPDLERAVAIKTPILPPGSPREFLREARAIADIHHPHICPVYDVGQHDGLPYIVMRYVKGGTLDTLLASAIPAPADALRFAEQIAKGLEAAHACGIIHRDLKPANVLFDEAANTLLIADFGLARWSEQTTASGGGIKGTPAYMAPEQWNPGGQFGNISALSDVYSLGVILFRMLTGVSLFPGTTSPEQMFAHSFTAPRKASEALPALGTQFDELCLWAVRKQPAERYPSAEKFASALADYREVLFRPWHLSTQEIERELFKLRLIYHQNDRHQFRAPMTLGCQSCGNRFRARDESAGKKVKCPHCQATVLVSTHQENEEIIDELARNLVCSDPRSASSPLITRGCRSCGKQFLSRDESIAKGQQCPKCATTAFVPEDC